MLSLLLLLKWTYYSLYWMAFTYQSRQHWVSMVKISKWIHHCGLGLLERKLNVSTECEEYPSTVNQIIHSVANGVWCHYASAAVRTLRSYSLMSRSCVHLLNCNPSIMHIFYNFALTKIRPQEYPGTKIFLERGVPMDGNYLR